MGKYKKEFEEVYLFHYWGDKTNTGEYYKRPYSKTQKNKQQEENQ